MINTEKETMQEIGQRFKQFRKENNIKQEDLLEVATVAAISRIENGHRLPNVEILIYMVNKYGMDINWVLSGETSKKPTPINTEILARLSLLEVRIKELEKDAGKNLFQ